MVVCIHTNQHNPSKLLHAITAGQDGVGLFFILSGFLVTALLLREQKKRGSINIGHFYFRRAMRILPPLLAYLLTVIVIQHFRHTSVPWSVTASVLFFAHNMMGGGTWMLEHTWSLAVEEQFYLLWPLMLVPALAISRRAAVLSAAGLIVAAPVFRIGGHLLHWQFLHHREDILLPTRMDALLCGCLVALLIDNNRFESAYNALERYWWVAASYLFILAPYLSDHFFPVYDATVGYTLDSIAGAFFILWLSRNEGHFLGRIANAKPIARIGMASYSIYLWQTLATHTAVGALQVAGGLLFIAAMSALSYYFIEGPAAIARGQIERLFGTRRAEILTPTTISAS